MESYTTLAEIGDFLNTLESDHKYSLHQCERDGQYCCLWHRLIAETLSSVNVIMRMLQIRKMVETGQKMLESNPLDYYVRTGVIAMRSEIDTKVNMVSQKLREVHVRIKDYETEVEHLREKEKMLRGRAMIMYASGEWQDSEQLSSLDKDVETLSQQIQSLNNKILSLKLLLDYLEQRSTFLMTPN